VATPNARDDVKHDIGGGAITFPTTGTIGNVASKLCISSLNIVWQLGNGLTYDIAADGTTKLYITQRHHVAAIRFNGIRNYKRAWGIQLNGEIKAACGMSIIMSYPDKEAPDQQFLPSFTPTPPAKLLPIELRATVQQAAAYEFDITELQTDFTAPGFGAGYSLTGFTFYVGVQKGPATIAESRRF
jgi:hypothetical protein